GEASSPPSGGRRAASAADSPPSNTGSPVAGVPSRDTGSIGAVGPVADARGGSGAAGLAAGDLAGWFSDPTAGPGRIAAFVEGAEADVLSQILDRARAAEDRRVLAVLWSILRPGAAPDARFWDAAFHAAFGHLGTAPTAGLLAERLLEHLTGDPAAAARIKPTVRARLRTVSDPAHRRAAAVILAGWDAGTPGAEPDMADARHLALTDRAGLVLLHPFLPVLFDRLGLTGPDGFTGAEAQVAALGALRALLADPTPAPADPLEERLLGLPDSVAPAAPPRDPETEALADSLLTAVVEQWSALGQTSIDGLRQTFLRRSGTVDASAPDRVVLDVDPGPYDMLLDQLPWSLGILRYRWMADPLHVVWRDREGRP
ncbi:MAG: contractile injection system tape measure protein, partial [Pseudomonadota bacterium]